MYPCSELGLDRVVQVILGLSNPVVGNSLALLSKLQQRCFLKLWIKYFMLPILHIRSFIMPDCDTD